MPTTNSLRTAIDASVTLLPLASTNDFPNSGVCQIESEMIHYGFSGANTLESCTRGFAGTTAATHAFDKAVTFVSVDSPSTTVSGSEYLTETIGDTHSHQTDAADLTVLAGVGSNTGSNPKFIAAAMWNIFGASLTKVANYLAGVIGAYSITGTKSSTYPTGAVLAQISDGVTDVDGAVVAYIDGDSSTTIANAAFKVMSNNSNPGSGFHWGVDLKGATHDGYPAVAFLDGEVRFSNGTKVTVSGDTVVFTNAAGSKHFTITMV